MKNYIIQLQELKIAKERLNVLRQKKELYLIRATDVTSKIKGSAAYSSGTTDKMTDYVIKCDRVDKQIKELEEEIKIMEKSVGKMDSYLTEGKSKSDIENKVFIYYFKENKNPNQIASLIPCGIATVYRKLKEIKKELNYDK